MGIVLAGVQSGLTESGRRVRLSFQWPFTSTVICIEGLDTIEEYLSQFTSGTSLRSYKSKRCCDPSLGKGLIDTCCTHVDHTTASS